MTCGAAGCSAVCCGGVTCGAVGDEDSGFASTSSCSCTASLDSTASVTGET